MTAAGPAEGLARSTARGAAWSYATFLVSKGIALISTLVLARLLAPDDFGLVALALVLMNHLDVINDFGIISAVIWRRGDLERTSDTAFAVSLIVGAVLSATTFVLAPLVAAGYGEPRVAPVLAALSVTFLIASFGSVQDARLRRALAFRRRFVAELAKATAKAGVTIALAAAGFGVWGLVAGQVAGVAVGALGYWVLAGWRPRLALESEVARGLVAYGGQITLLGLLAVAASNVDYVVIGRRQGATALGFYVLAFRLPGLLILNSCSVLSQVIFPVFARVTHDDRSLRGALLRAIRTLAALTVPAGLGIVLVAPDLVTVLFGARWDAAVPVMRWLAVFTVLSTILYNDGDVYKAIGRPAVLNVITAVQLVLAVPALWWAAGSGIEAVALAQVAVAGVVLALRVGVLRHVLHVGVGEVAAALRPVLVSATAMAGSVLLVQVVVPDGAPLVRLALSCVAGAGVYAGSLVAVDRRWATEMLRLLVDRGRSRPEPAPLIPAGQG